jgi:hypothetical protein
MFFMIGDTRPHKALFRDQKRPHNEIELVVAPMPSDGRSDGSCAAGRSLLSGDGARMPGGFGNGKRLATRLSGRVERAPLRRIET